jgi:hypothetical protein
MDTLYIIIMVYLGYRVAVTIGLWVESKLPYEWDYNYQAMISLEDLTPEKRREVLKRIEAALGEDKFNTKTVDRKGEIIHHYRVSTYEKKVYLMPMLKAIKKAIWPEK